MTDEWREEAKALNQGLHELAACEPCETACTHFVAPRWSLLGLANVAARAMSDALSDHTEGTP